MVLIMPERAVYGMYFIAAECTAPFSGNLSWNISLEIFWKNDWKKAKKSAYNFLQLFYNFCPKSDEAGGQFMKSKKFEKTHENADFQAKRAAMKRDETVKTQIPTMKPLD